MFNPRILITGGREYNNRKFVYAALNKMYNSFYIGKITIIEGGAKGADRLAQQWAKQPHIDVILLTEEAEWDRYGDSAGMRRNKQMADLKPDLCIAFKGGKGTRNMIEICEDREISVYRLDW